MITRAERRHYFSKKLRLIFLLLVLIIVGLFFIFYADYRSLLSSVKTKQAVADNDIAIIIEPNDLEIVVQERLEDSLSRPLMMSTRRPYAPPKAIPKPKPKPEPKPPEEVPEISEQLASVIITDDRKLVFLNGAEGTIRLEEGMMYKKWQVNEITPDTLTLIFNDQKKVLQLRKFATAMPIAPMRQLGKQNKKN